MSRRTRLVVIPAVLFVLVSGTVYVLAELHPAKQEEAATSTPAPGSEAALGENLFAENCARCHGEGGTGGGIGPTLAGSGISTEEARTVIVNGRAPMPAGLVVGAELEAVLAYLKTITR
jgi:mono/diheme cytochrome c family protein